MLLAQLENKIDQVKVLHDELNATHKAIAMFSAMSETEQTRWYKYTSPIDTLDKFTSPFGYRELLNPFTGGMTKGKHQGFDIVGQWHCEIKPIAPDGEVIDVWPVPNWYYKGHPLFGGYVRIKHDDGWITGYGHLSSIYVKEGDKLIDGLFYRNGKLLKSEGTLGRQGNTGMSTGEHLHLSIETPDGIFVNPLRWTAL